MSGGASQPLIRAAAPADVEALVALENSVFETDRISRRSFLRFINSPSAEVLVAQGAGGGIAGYALNLYRRTTSVARLYSIATTEGARGSGVGRALMEAAEISGAPAWRTVHAARGQARQPAGHRAV